MAARADNPLRTLLWSTAAGVPIALSIAAFVPSYVNHDAAWYLHMAGVWLDGATLYQDVVDTNPPLIVFLSAVPVWLARVAGMSVPAVFKAWVFTLAALSIALASGPIRQAWHREPWRLLILGMLAFALLPFVQDEFGQREHFAVILTMPFVMQGCVRAAGGSVDGRAGAVAGAMAGFGFALKPHFLLAWAAVEVSGAAVSARAPRATDPRRLRRRRRSAATP